MKIKKISVNLKNKNYLIHVGLNIFNSKKNFLPLKTNDRIILVTNTVISTIWKKNIIDYFFQYTVHIDEFIFPDGEIHKTLYSAELLLSFLLKKNHDRNSVLIAFGGGVIGDLTGFVASIYQRGIKFIQIPTTLLSQVDASIGGKTGVNHVLGKNMIGSFWQPYTVITDLMFLNTLPKQQLVSGIAEIIKYAISFDYLFFLWIEKKINQLLLLNSKVMINCIKQCCELKSKIISIDEREQDLRMLLNLGHTYGHAIEAYSQYSKWLHGESISVGIVIAVKTAQILGLLNYIDAKRIIRLISYAGLPIHAPSNMHPQDYLKYMVRDKKNCSGKITLVLPVSIGEVKIIKNIDKHILFSSIQSCIC